jgi:hypothetical protein
LWIEGTFKNLSVPKNIILNEVNKAQKDKGRMFSLICGRQAWEKYKRYYGKKGRSLMGEER